MTDFIQLYTTNDINTAPSDSFSYPVDAYGAEIQMEAMRNLHMSFDPHYSVFLAGPNVEPQKLKSKYTLRSLGASSGMVLYVLLTDPKPNSSIPTNTRPLNGQTFLPRLNTSHSNKGPVLNKLSTPGAPSLRPQITSDLAPKPIPLIMQNKGLKSNQILANKPSDNIPNHPFLNSSVQRGHAQNLSSLKSQIPYPKPSNNNNNNNANNQIGNPTNENIKKNPSLDEDPNSSSELAPYLFKETDFDIIKTNHSFSIATEKSTGITYAIKKLKGQIQTEKLFKEFLNIFNAEAGCVLHIEGLIQNPPSIIYEYSSYGSLENILDAECIMESPDEWDSTAKMITLFGIAEGMRELHSKRIMHRNLKPSNIIFDDHLFPKIGDAGFTREYEHNPSYMAPEMLSGGPYKSKVDIFAYGMIVYQLISEKPPFEPSVSFHQIKKFILAGKRPKIPDNVPPNYSSLIENCWNQDPTVRPSFNSIVEMFVKGSLNFPDADLDAFKDFQNTFTPQYDPERAKVTPIQKSAKQGNSESQLTFSRYLMRGIGVVKNMKEGVKYLKMSADNGNDKAQFLFGRLLLRFDKQVDEATKYLLKSATSGNSHSKALLSYLQHGPSSTTVSSNASQTDITALLERAADLKKKDPQESFNCFKKAADLGNSKAQLQVALAYHNGQMGVTKDLTEANKYYKLAGDQGNAKALCNLAFNMQNGNGIAKDVKQANELFLKSSEKGYSTAQYNYGCNLMNGVGVDQNQKEANKYFKLAADNGHSQAMMTYATNLSKGIGIGKNLTEANKYIKLAIDADEKNVNALFLYANNLLNGNGIEKNPEEANKYYKKAADLGHSRSMFNYAFNLQKGIGFDHKDVVEANKYYKMSADLKYPVAQYNYAINLESGNGVDKDVAEANKYYKMAADLGNSNAQYSYAMNLIKGVGVQTNIDLANKYLKKSVDQKNHRAQYQYALHLQKGTGVEQDRKLANDLLKLSADQGNINAQFYYGYNLFNGNGIDKNPEEANKYYKMAADKGNSNSQCNLACSYLNGIGIDKDIEKANKYYKMSADSGNAVAQYNYGLHLMNGKGVEKNVKLGAVYLKKSADSGNSSAQYCMSFCFENGTGVAINKELAEKYLKMSAAGGNKLAIQNLKH